MAPPYAPPPATSSTLVLRCDPSSITFGADDEPPTISSPETADALAIAARALVDDLECVAFPTETVYGLGALALDASAAAKIFITKGRPADNPLIVHVSSFAMLRALLPPEYTPPHAYTALMDAFWPGPLTLLFPASPLVPGIITAGQPTVAVRMPAHPVARALIAAAHAPLAAPSANASGAPSATRAAHVLRGAGALAGRAHLRVLLDGGACGVGLESTVVDGLQPDGALRVLRPGGVTVEELERVLAATTPADAAVPRVLVHRRDYADEEQERAPTTPGMKYRHYSPTVPVTLLFTSTRPPAGVDALPFSAFIASLASDAAKRSRPPPLKIGLLAPSDSPLGTRLLGTPVDGVEWCPYALGAVAEPAVTAHRLFDGLLQLELDGVDCILVEEVGEEREGLAVMNRVRKAAGESKWVQVN